MSDSSWDRYSNDTFELWDQLIWIVAQWICQERGGTGDGDSEHIRNPAVSNDPCDPCYDEASSLVNDGLCLVLQALGRAAYSCGRLGVPEQEAASRALGAMIERTVGMVLRVSADCQGLGYLPFFPMLGDSCRRSTLQPGRERCLEWLEPGGQSFLSTRGQRLLARDP